MGARKASPNSFLESLRGNKQNPEKHKQVELVSQQSVELENPQATEIRKKSEAAADARRG